MRALGMVLGGLGMVAGLAACGESGSTEGGGGREDEAVGAAEQPLAQPDGVPPAGGFNGVIGCGQSRVAQQTDNRKLEAHTVGPTEAVARARCESSRWMPGYSAYVCGADRTCGEMAYPDCEIYYGPDAFETEACACQSLLGRQWLCIKKGEVPVGSLVECGSCYQHHTQIPCGQKLALPANADGLVRAVGTGDSEAAARQQCETAVWGSAAFMCARDGVGQSAPPVFQVEGATACACELQLVNPDSWRCERTALIVLGSDIDCTNCPAAP